MEEEEAAVAEAAVVEEAVVVEVVAAEAVVAEAAEEEPLPQEEQPMRTQSCWEENPNTLKGIDEMSTDSSRTSSPVATHCLL